MFFVCIHTRDNIPHKKSAARFPTKAQTSNISSCGLGSASQDEIAHKQCHPGQAYQQGYIVARTLANIYTQTRLSGRFWEDKK